MSEAILTQITPSSKEPSEPNLSSAISSKYLDGLDSTQSSKSYYSFTFPEGTRVIVVSYRTWGSNMYVYMYVYLDLMLFTVMVKDNKDYMPIPFSEVYSKKPSMACSSITVTGRVFAITCNCPTPGSGGSGISFSAYK